MKYNDDLTAWCEEQANILRRRAANEIDWDNLAEEIEAVGRSERREIRSRLEILLVHLLKWQFQPEWRSMSWEASIDEARQRMADVIEDNPSLAAEPAKALANAYRRAMQNRMIRQLELNQLPETCPWPVEDILRADFLPGEK